MLKPGAFRLVDGAAALSDHSFGTTQGHRRFCSTCGCAPFSDDHGEEIDGDCVSVNLRCLDDITPEALAAAPVRHFDGLHDNWWIEPAVTSCL
jgi:hypothetical protein